MSDENNAETAIEPVPIQDTYICGVDHVEFLGRNSVRIWLYVDENGQRVIKDKIVMAIEAIPECIATVLRATGARAMRFPWIDELAFADRSGRH